MSIFLKMIIAGISFGIWPICMNKSGFSGTVASIIFSTVILFSLILFSLLPAIRLTRFSGNEIWWWAIIAGIFGAIGLIFFNSGLSQLTPEKMGPYFIFMILVQIAAPTMYHAFLNGRVTVREGAIIAAAVFAAVLQGTGPSQ